MICLLLDKFLFRWCYMSLQSIFFFVCVCVCVGARAHNICSCLSSMNDVKFDWHDWQPIQDCLFVCNISGVCCRQPMQDT
jgi:hypothetical protein